MVSAGGTVRTTPCDAYFGARCNSHVDAVAVATAIVTPHAELCVTNTGPTPYRNKFARANGLLKQGSTSYRMEPSGTYRQDFLNLLSLRADKRFKLAGQHGFAEIGARQDGVGRKLRPQCSAPAAKFSCLFPSV